ncbi:hypothetical protein ATY75_29085 [Rhizobium sp. N122]|nr:hypothetical protein ATY75_29085 [Rhizobium sp. N122]
MLTVWFRTTDGKEVECLVVIKSSAPGEQERDRKELSTLMDTVGLDDLPNSGDLTGREADLMISHHGNFVSCSRLWVLAPAPRFTDVVN